MSSKIKLNAPAKTVAQLFTKNPERWIKNVYKENKTKVNSVTKKREWVPCYCLMGAVKEIYTEKHQTIVENKLKKVIRAYTLGKVKIEDGMVEEWNDKRGRTIEDIQRVAMLAGV